MYYIIEKQKTQIENLNLRVLEQQKKILLVSTKIDYLDENFDKKIDKQNKYFDSSINRQNDLIEMYFSYVDTEFNYIHDFNETNLHFNQKNFTKIRSNNKTKYKKIKKIYLLKKYKCI